MIYSLIESSYRSYGIFSFQIFLIISKLEFICKYFTFIEICPIDIANTKNDLFLIYTYMEVTGDYKRPILRTFPMWPINLNRILRTFPMWHINLNRILRTFPIWHIKLNDFVEFKHSYRFQMLLFVELVKLIISKGLVWPWKPLRICL